MSSKEEGGIKLFDKILMLGIVAYACLGGSRDSLGSDQRPSPEGPSPKGSSLERPSPEGQNQGCLATIISLKLNFIGKEIQYLQYLKGNECTMALAHGLKSL